MQIIKIDSNDPALNLAYEEYLIEQKQDIIYFWQNEPTIVIGRNQNPYSECNLEKIREDKVNLMRRRSGGGAVYHDYGNINFTIISKKEVGVIENNFNLVIKALKNLNIDAYINGRNDLEVDGKKISGSAFYEEDDIYCHHGTLLINTDMTKLSKYLIPSKLKLESKGITSVKSRVANLISFNKNITIDKFINEVCKICGSPLKLITKEDVLSIPSVKIKIDKYRSWEWTYGESMGFNAQLEKKFDWGIINIDFLIDSGIIKNSKIYTDSLLTNDFDLIAKEFISLEFKKEKLQSVINNSKLDKNLKDDINSLFEEI